jgi:hypothetical protein
MIDLEFGALVCGHVAKGYPVRRAFRDEPVDTADSGWQFFCGSGQAERIDDARVWSLGQVLKHEPSLEPYLSLPPGAELFRSPDNSCWIKQT